MGGDGSGRKPDMVKRLLGLNQPANTGVAPAFYLPNLSEIKTKGSSDPIISQLNKIDYSFMGRSIFTKNIQRADWLEYIPSIYDVTIGNYWQVNYNEKGKNDLGLSYGNSFESIIPAGTSLNHTIIGMRGAITLNGDNMADSIAQSCHIIQNSGTAGIIEALQIRRDLFGESDDVAAIFIEDFSKTTLEGEGATINNDSYSIYSQGGKVIFENCDNFVIDTGTGNTIGDSCALEIHSTTGALLLPRMTTAERDNLNAIAGMMIFNTSIMNMQVYNGVTWV